MLTITLKTAADQYLMAKIYNKIDELQTLIQVSMNCKKKLAK